MTDDDALRTLLEEQSPRAPRPGQLRFADVAEVTLET